MIYQKLFLFKNSRYVSKIHELQQHCYKRILYKKHSIQLHNQNLSIKIYFFHF